MTAQEIIEGTILLFDKPLNWSSFDVVNKVRILIQKRFHLQKIKVGHAGTLDPLATGLLVICTGRKTKDIESIQATDKEYIATIGLGHTTPSFDLETEFNSSYPTEHISLKTIEEILPKFIGEIEQVPPIYSAKMVDGHRAYKMARKGHEVKMNSQTIIIHNIELLSFNNNSFTIKICCSKGTYIRSLAHDLGVALSSGAYLQSLRRTRSGIYDVKNAFSLEEFEKILLTLQPLTLGENSQLSY
jgi:tRNA pseudouridine55 synthase